MSSDSGTEMASPQLARAFAVVGMGGGGRINRGYQPSRTPSSRYHVIFIICFKEFVYRFTSIIYNGYVFKSRLFDDEKLVSIFT